MTIVGPPCRSVQTVTTTKNRFLYLATATVLGLTLASCSGDTGGDETTDAGEDTTTTEQTEGAGDEGEGATTDEGEGESGDDGGETSATGAECLIGTWEMTMDAMEEQVIAQLGGDAEVSVEGTSTMTFDGTNVTSEAHNSSEYSADVQGTAVEGSTETDGTIVVSYTADDATLTYVDVVSAEGTITVTVAGTTQEQDIADTAEMMSGQTQNYTCTDTELTLSTEMEGMEYSQVFTRA